MLGKIEGKRRSGQQRMRWIDSITDSVHRGAWRAAVRGVTESDMIW